MFSGMKVMKLSNLSPHWLLPKLWQKTELIILLPNFSLLWFILQKSLSWIPSLIMPLLWSEPFSKPLSPTELKTASNLVSHNPSKSHSLQKWYCARGRGSVWKRWGILSSDQTDMTGFRGWSWEHILPEVIKNHVPQNTNGIPIEKLFWKTTETIEKLSAYLFNISY